MVVTMSKIKELTGRELDVAVQRIVFGSDVRKNQGNGPVATCETSIVVKPGDYYYYTDSNEIYRLPNYSTSKTCAYSLVDFAVSNGALVETTVWKNGSMVTIEDYKGDGNAFETGDTPEIAICRALIMAELSLSSSHLEDEIVLCSAGNG